MFNFILNVSFDIWRGKKNIALSHYMVYKHAAALFF